MAVGSPPEPPLSGAAPARCQPAVTQLTEALPASHLCLLAPERGRKEPREGSAVPRVAPALAGSGRTHPRSGGRMLGGSLSTWLMIFLC